MDFISQPELRNSAAEPFCFYRLERSDVPDCLKMRRNDWQSNCTRKNRVSKRKPKKKGQKIRNLSIVWARESGDYSFCVKKGVLRSLPNQFLSVVYMVVERKSCGW